MVHVLALNLIGWCFKGLAAHFPITRKWNDCIPVLMVGMGIFFAWIYPTEGARNFVLQGMANAGLAWLLHQGLKRSAQIVKEIKEKKSGKKEVTRDQ